ncbi:hypothetical protein RBI14_18415 [Alcaligenaceae bacterium B3P038]|nr:hypothetical protein [Alcaligenaceae bacterium B3P038]
MRRLLLTGLCAVTLLFGCASRGVDASGDFPSQAFDVPTDYYQAQRRIREYLKACYVDRQHAYNVAYDFTGSIDPKATTGETRLFTVNEPARALMRFKVQPAGDRSTKATLTVMGIAPFDQQEMDAAIRSIQSATPMCRDGTNPLAG